MHKNNGETAKPAAGDGTVAKMRRHAEELVHHFGEIVGKFRIPSATADFDQARQFGELLGRYVEMISRLPGGLAAEALPPAATSAAPAAPAQAAPAKPQAPESKSGEIKIPAKHAAAAAPPPAPAAAHAGAEPAPEPERVLRDPMQVVHELQDVERDLEKLLAKPEGELSPDAKLLMLKSYACRQRGLFDELQMQRFDDTRARELYGALKDAIEKTVPKTSEPQPFQYVIPLDTRVGPRAPLDWYEAARRYADLLECLAGLEWILSTVGFLSDADKKEILEPIAARQQRLYRFLQQRFHCAGQDALSDPQQGALFGRLREYARTNSIFLNGLNGQTEETELERLAEQLPGAVERQKTRVKRRQEQEEAVAKVLSTVAGPKFGSREQHGDMLRVMVRRALEAGVLPSNATLRDALMGWAHLLAGDEKIAPLVRAIEVAQRRKDAEQALADAESRATVLEPHRSAELEKVLPLVAGTRAVMIGGECREDNRKAICETLKLTDVVWNDTNGRESVYDFEPLVAHPDTRVVFLMIRFMRTGYGRVAELCRKHSKILVRLPAGYGVNQVIHQLAEQMGGQSAHAPPPSSSSSDSAGKAEKAETTPA